MLDCVYSTTLQHPVALCRYGFLVHLAVCMQLRLTLNLLLFIVAQATRFGLLVHLHAYRLCT
jgi:hypothetical protein